MFDEFYQGKSILVTGVTGVKGSWLALMLLRAGARVIGLDRRSPERNSNFFAAGLRQRIEFVHGDVMDAGLMESLVRCVDGVFHLAAVALVRDAYRDAFEAYRSNTLGVVVLLEAIRRATQMTRAVFITTDKVYRPKNGDPWTETDPLVASGPYAVSKACAEFIVADYQRMYFRNSGVRIGVARAGNVLIGGDFHSSSRSDGGGRIFVDCFEALQQGRQPEIFSPNFTRPYTYGLDILAGYATLMSMLHLPYVENEAFNFGPWEQYGVPNSLLATKICELWNEGIFWRTGPPREEPFEFQSLSMRKSQELLGWRPAYTLYEALRDTTQWYRAWAGQGAAPEEGCLRELNERLLDTHEMSSQRLGVHWAGDTAISTANRADANAA